MLAIEYDVEGDGQIHLVALINAVEKNGEDPDCLDPLQPILRRVLLLLDEETGHRRGQHVDESAAGKHEWALRDSNPRPQPCEGCALTS